MKLLILFCQLNNVRIYLNIRITNPVRRVQLILAKGGGGIVVPLVKLTIDLKQEIVKATLFKTLLDKIPSYLYSRTILPTIQQVCGASKKYEVTACKLSFSAVIR